MSAAPAYSHYSSNAYDMRYATQRSYASTEPAYNPTLEPDIHVVPGKRTRTSAAPAALPAPIVVGARIAALVMILVALVGFTQVFLKSATVTSSVEAQEISSKIDSARAEGNQLEVAQSSLSNPARIKSEANAMGMSAPVITSVISLDEDVVTCDSDGNLSLSKTLEQLASVSAVSAAGA
jgi:cell division protein FtsL